MTKESWKIQAQRAQAILENSIPKQWLAPPEKLPGAGQLDVHDFPRKNGLLSDRELAITDMSATALVDDMGVGKLSAEEVVVAFLKRAVLGHQLLNFATEFLAERAVTRARKLDEYFKETGKLVGPLHGVPISVKEHIGMKGLTHNASFVAWVDVIATEDALLLQYLEKAGAVFHVRTNQPQTLMHLDCSNNVTGTTLNPYNLALSPGGSSGGEGASMGFKCAPLGVGSDIGGSIRSPAAFCGAYGFRPTAERNTMVGGKVAASGKESVKGVIGPLASQSLEDIELFERAIIDQEPWSDDPSLVPLPWKRVEPRKDITVGIMWDDGIVRPHPPITRGLKYAKEKLLAAGIKIVDWEPFKHDECWEVVASLYFPDGAKREREILAESGEPTLPLTNWAFSYSRPTPLTVSENCEYNVRRQSLRSSYHHLMKERGVDFILSPTYCGVAAVLGESHYWNYTAIWNILDQPSAVFPTGLSQDPAVDILPEYKPRNAVDEREWTKYSRPELYTGAPICLQLTGKRFQDEETLAASKLVSGIVLS